MPSGDGTSRSDAMSRASFLVLAVAIVGVVTLLPSVSDAQTELPIDGSNFTVRCSGGVLATNKPWGNYPTTITGCVLASDTPFTVGGLGITCKGGSMVEFYAGTSKVKYCSLALDAARVINTAGVQQSCKAGNVIQITQDGKVSGCAPQTGGTGPGRPPTIATGGATGGTTGGGTTGGPTGGTTPGGGQPPTTPPTTPSGARIVVPAENGTISGAGQYTWSKPSSPRPGGRGGFVYLGDGRATATYTVSAPAAGRYDLWIRFDDDGKHAVGARAVEVYVNGAKTLAWSNPSRDTGGWVNIKIGSVDLHAGQNTIAFTKAQTTSAAFVLDEFALTAPGQIPQ
jgi:hypothetical protein